MQPNLKKRAATIAARIARDKATVIEQLKKTPIVQLACERSGVTRSTFYRWRDKDNEFAEAVAAALLEGTLLVNDVAESQLMTAIRERNMTAILFWLKHHHPAYTTKVEINAHIKDDYELTPEQKGLIQEALRLAALPKPGDLLTNAEQKDHETT